MSDTNRKVLLVTVSILPVIPLLYLFNQNHNYLDPRHILICGIILAVFTSLFYKFCCFIFQSEEHAFVASLTFVFLIFSYNKISLIFDINNNRNISLLIMFPALAYIIAYFSFKINNSLKFENFPILFAIGLSVLLALNTFNLIKNIYYFDDSNKDYSYKIYFHVENNLKTPNIYWFFCDGMLSFDAMKTYYNDEQTQFTNELITRGFNIKTDATLETGHLTKIAIPTLMCPDFYDKNLSNILSDHDSAMKLRDMADTKLYNARVNNETLNAFDAKGYYTITASINDHYFFPTTDRFYYVNTSYKSTKDYITNPYYVKRDDDFDYDSMKSRIYAYQLGDIFLGGLPSAIYDKFFNNSTSKEYPLSTQCDTTSEILLGESGHEVHIALVESLYDSIHIENVNKPKLLVIHDFMPHQPFVYDENGYPVDDFNDIVNYPGNHNYSAKVLLNLIDMVLEDDQDAVIVLQGDHGLHCQSEEEISVFSKDPNAKIDLWNGVISAIRIPAQYRNDEEEYALEDPRNISRFLINNYVGKNYDYIMP